MIGVLLVNTGSPKTCNRRDVKSFIRAMLSDPYVMTVPDWIRPILVNGVIIPLRQFTSTSHYHKIWDHKRNISPLLYHTNSLAQKIESKTGFVTEIAMRYEEPSIKQAFDRLMTKNDKLHEVIVLPLFPHYAQSSYQTAVNEVGRIFMERPYPFRLKFIDPYYDHIAYIHSLVKSMKPIIAEPYDKIIFSFHSLPVSHVEALWEKGKDFDYVYQTKETIRLVQKALNLESKKIRLTYHSAMGTNWIGPDLNNTVKELAKQGVKNILVVAPGFSADNLETLYDINIVTKKIFYKYGGSHFSYVPCLNSENYWVDGVIKIISE